MLGVRPVIEQGQSQVYADFSEDVSTLTTRGTWWEGHDAQRIRNSPSTVLAEAMASCTAITYVNDKLVGDPLDVQMFEATGWVLDESQQK